MLGLASRSFLTLLPSILGKLSVVASWNSCCASDSCASRLSCMFYVRLLIYLLHSHLRQCIGASCLHQLLGRKHVALKLIEQTLKDITFCFIIRKRSSRNWIFSKIYYTLVLIFYQFMFWGHYLFKSGQNCLLSILTTTTYKSQSYDNFTSCTLF